MLKTIFCFCLLLLAVLVSSSCESPVPVSKETTPLYPSAKKLAKFNDIIVDLSTNDYVPKFRKLGYRIKETLMMGFTPEIEPQDVINFYDAEFNKFGFKKTDESDFVNVGENDSKYKTVYWKRETFRTNELIVFAWIEIHNQETYKIAIIDFTGYNAEK